VADWSRGLLSGGLEQGLVEWRTGAGACSVADWHRVLFSGQRAGPRTFTYLLHCQPFVLCCCILSLNTFISSATVAARKHSQLYPQLVACSGRQTLIVPLTLCAEGQQPHRRSPLIISQRSIICFCLIRNT